MTTSHTQHTKFTPSARLVTILSDLPDETRAFVLAQTTAFLDQRSTNTMSYLAMGQHLLAIKDVLEPMGKWKAYTLSLPNVSQSTAQRMVHRVSELGGTTESDP